MKILITAGPTREPWDSIRYLSNRSSGRMGYAIAEAAGTLGHEVTLISGPVALQPPKGVRFLPVTTALEMEKACKRMFSQVDAVIMAAAVADFRPARRVAGKLKKEGSRILSLRLVKNPDILLGLGRRKGSRKLIGFALEAADGLANARGKLRRKNLDFIVLNGPGALEGERASVTVFGRDGSRRDWKSVTKQEIGRRLVALLEAEQEAAGR